MSSKIVRKALTATAVLALAALPAAAQVDDHRDIEFPPLPALEIPKPEIFELDNGLKVFLIEDHELPLIDVTARIRTGSDYEPAARTGLARLTGVVQRTGGTKTMAGDAIDDFLAARAAFIETSAGGDAAFASMNCLREDFDEVFRLFADVLRKPVFEADKLEVAKVQANASIARRNDSVTSIASREFSRLIYGAGSPLARLEEYATIGSIDRDDLVSWHKTYYVPNNTYLGIVGDFDAKAMKKKVQAVFGDWKKGTAFRPGEVPYAKTLQAGIHFIEKSDVNQANIGVGHLGIRRDNPDYFAVRVMNEVLGGSFASRLFNNIRSEKGLAYSVGGGVGTAYSHPGVFRIALQTKSETMGEALDAVIAEVRGLIDNPPGIEEMNRAKEAILNSFVFNFDSREEVLNQQMAFAYHGLPLDYLDTFRQNIEKVTREDVARVAKKYVHPDKLTVLVVGKSADFDKPLSSFGPVKDVDIAIAPPAAAPRATETAASLDEGRSLVGRMAKAILGSSPVKVKSARQSAMVKAATPMGEMTIEQEQWIVFPDQVRIEQRLPVGSVTIVFDGSEGALMTPMGNRPMPDSLKSEILSGIARDPVYLATKTGDASLKAVAAGTREVDGRDCPVVQVDFGPATVRLTLDPETSLPISAAYQGSGPDGAPADIETTFGDWRDVSGVKVPWSVRRTSNGEEAQSLTVEEFELNPTLEASLFQKPAA